MKYVSSRAKVMNFINMSVFNRDHEKNELQEFFNYEKVIVAIIVTCAVSPKLAKECVDAQLVFRNLEVKEGKF